MAPRGEALRHSTCTQVAPRLVTNGDSSRRGTKRSTATAQKQNKKKKRHLPAVSTRSPPSATRSLRSMMSWPSAPGAHHATVSTHATRMTGRSSSLGDISRPSASCKVWSAGRFCFFRISLFWHFHHFGIFMKFCQHTKSKKKKNWSASAVSIPTGLARLFSATKWPPRASEVCCWRLPAWFPPPLTRWR